MKSPSRVLECGCGIGVSAMLLSWLGYEVTAVDVDALIVERAKKLASILAPKVKFQVDDIFKMPSAQYDLVTCLGVLEHFNPDDKETNLALALVEKLSQFGDNILVTVPTMYPPGPAPRVHVLYSAAMLKQLLKASGEQVLSVYKWEQTLAVLAKRAVTSKERIRGTLIPLLLG